MGEVGGTSPRGVAICARRSCARSGVASPAPSLSGLLWQAGAVAAPLVVKYAIDHGIVPQRPPRAARLAVRAAGRGAARGLRRRLPPPLRDPQPLPLRRGRPRRPLRPRAAARRHLPRPRRPGRAAQPRLVGLAARRADDGRDRAHDRLRADRGRGRDRDARPRLAARARGADPGAVRDASAPGSTRAATTRARASCRRAGPRRRRSSRRPSAGSASSRGSAPATRCPSASARRSVEIMNRALALARLDAVFIPVLEMLPLLGIAAVLWLGGPQRDQRRPDRRLVRRLQRLRGDARLAAARARPARDDAAEGARREQPHH